MSTVEIEGMKNRIEELSVRLQSLANDNSYYIAEIIALRERIRLLEERLKP